MMIRLAAVLGCLLLIAGCAATGPKRGSTGTKPFVQRDVRGIWQPEAFHTVLTAEINLNKNYFKAAPQLKNFREVLWLAEAIEKEFSFVVTDELETRPGPLGRETIVFKSFNDPKLELRGKTRFERKRGDRTQVFEIGVRILPPTAYRIGAQHGPKKKLPIRKTAKIQYRLVCSPGAADERVLCFHRELRLDPATNMETRRKR